MGLLLYLILDNVNPLLIIPASKPNKLKKVKPFSRRTVSVQGGRRLRVEEENVDQHGDGGGGGMGNRSDVYNNKRFASRLCMLDVCLYFGLMLCVFGVTDV